ncbi:MAG: nitrate reductase subunit alpha [Bacteroidales bacterium]|nr:nitrate reductase subunit alpha [Bacteroidales bacterium]
MIEDNRHIIPKKEYTSDNFVETEMKDREWEKFYENRWHHDKITRSTHGVNCTGSCSWKIFVKNGVVTWETQHTDYPKNRPSIPNHEPRGCPRGASYSWYLYNSGRVKYPMVRSSLIRSYRDEKEKVGDPVVAWENVMDNEQARKQYISQRGLGGLVRIGWHEALEIISAANIYTIKKYGPDRISGFSPIPAFSMVSYCAGTRYLSLLGGAVLSFYDFYCDLPPSSPQTWGEQTDVPESADWYSSDYLILWGSNVPVTRTPDAHFMVEGRYKGTKVVIVSSDYSDASKFADTWMSPKQGTDSALGMAMGHVILNEYYNKRKVPYFIDYVKRFSNLPFLVKLDNKDDHFVCGSMLRASDFKDNLGIEDNPQWRLIVKDEASGELMLPNGTIGSRWDKSAKWNLDLKDVRNEKEINPALSFIDNRDDVVEVEFPYFGGSEYKNPYYDAVGNNSSFKRKVPAIKIKDGENEFVCATAFDLLFGNYGVDRGLDDSSCAKSYDDIVPFTPAWQEKITGVPKQEVIRIAKEFALNAEKNNGSSMVIIGAGVNQWYNTDMTYRSVITMCVLCGTIGQSGGGWSHYVGQEKIRPLAGWGTLAFANDWIRPSRQMNSTNYFYQHTDQWRYEKVIMKDLLAVTSNTKEWDGMSIVDSIVKAQRLGWTPTAPQINMNSLHVVKNAEIDGKTPQDWIVEKMGKGEVKMAGEDIDNPINWPRNLFIWRSNLIGCSGKGMEYFMKHLLGAQNGVLGEDISKLGLSLPKDVKWYDNAPEGKCDLVVTIDYRMTTSSLHSDIVLPAATWYEKNDLSSTDMHQFLHPFSQAVDPVWEARSDWNIFKELSKNISDLSKGHLGIEKDIMMQPWMHDTPEEISEPITVSDWKSHGVNPTPGKNMPNMVIVERNYSQIFNQFTSLGPLMSTKGNGAKGINWNAKQEVDYLGEHNFLVEEDNIAKGRPKIDSDIDGVNTILTLSPESNGEVGKKAWQSLKEKTGKDLSQLSSGHFSDHITFQQIERQPRRAFTSPCWSGVDSEELNYNASYINVHYSIPWRTLSGRQEVYQDHPWMIDFGEAFVTYKPPLITRAVSALLEKVPDKNNIIVLALPTPHNKWTIHSMWSDNLLMLTLGRGGPVVWISEKDANKLNIKDNDWLEMYNDNGATMARAVVSQRMPEGLAYLYHNQERTVNMPVSPITNHRGGVHNSISKLCPRPTHQIGGYANLSYSMNYYGGIGANRDEIVIVRKVDNVEWQSQELSLE